MVPASYRPARTTFTIARDEPCVAAAVHRGIRFRSLSMRVLAKLFGS